MPQKNSKIKKILKFLEANSHNSQRLGTGKPGLESPSEFPGKNEHLKIGSSL